MESNSGDFDGSGADKDGTSGLHHVLHLLDDGRIFLFLCAVDTVVLVVAYHGTVGRDFGHLQLVNVVELASLGHSRAGHTGELAIHTEIVLERDCGIRLSGGLNLHALLGLDGLVKSVAVATSLHDTSGLLIYDLDFIVVDDVFHVLVEERVSLQELVDGVHALSLDGISLERGVFHFLMFLLGSLLVLNGRQLGGDVGKDEEIGVLGRACQHLDTLVGQLNAMVFLINDEEQGLHSLGHLPIVVGHIFSLHLEKELLYSLFAKIANERIVLRKTFVSTEKRETALFEKLVGCQGLLPSPLSYFAIRSASPLIAAEILSLASRSKPCTSLR